MNRMERCCKEGIQQAEEALGIYERLGDRIGQPDALTTLAWVLFDDYQVDIASRAIDLVPEKKQGISYVFHTSTSRHHLLVQEQAKTGVVPFGNSLEIAYTANWRDHLFGRQGSSLSRANSMRQPPRSNKAGWIWYKQRRLVDAKSEVLGGLEIYQRFGVEGEVEGCEVLLQKIEKAMKSLATTFRRRVSGNDAVSHTD